MKALFTPTERLTVRLIGDYLNVDEQATPFSLLQVNQNAYVALYNTCISGNPGFYAPVAALAGVPAAGVNALCTNVRGHAGSRSEEHTSELQSLMRTSYAVFCLKKTTQQPFLYYSK